MKSFLQHIIDDIEDCGPLKEQAYIFPNRRACIYFKKLLMDRFQDQSFWSPTILSIEDFVVKVTGRAINDNLTLLLELFSVYKQHQDLSFERFYSWGQILLNDFDEVDRNLVDTDKLYQNLKDLQDIEESFGGNEEVMEAIRQFNKVINIEDKSRLLLDFINTWDTVSKVYGKFKARLLDKGLAYGGMLYRELAGRISMNKKTIPYSKVFFCGFNALSKAEEVIFNELLDQDKCGLYWDADSLFLEDPMEEAGKFIRKYRKMWDHPESKWIITNLLEDKKFVNIMGTAQAIGQAKIAGNQLLKHLGNEDQTAVVLADETLLFPVLYALPAELNKVNVTMGYPLQNSIANSLVESFLLLQTQIKKGSIQVKPILQYLSNPIIRNISPEKCLKVSKELINRKTKWISGENISALINHKLINISFQCYSNSGDLISALTDFIIRIQNLFRLSRDPVVEKEFFYHLVKQLNQLKSVLLSHQLDPEPKLLSKLISEVIRDTKIPFTGEPLTGVQIMGLLESRTLDFENLIILSLNENKLPAGRDKPTYIPFAMRKAFGMPTFEDHDAIYAYHFKRLLQRAKNVTLIYDTEVAVDGSGEKSRFLIQLENSFSNTSNIHLTSQVLSLPMEVSRDDKTVTVNKSTEILQVLQKYQKSEKEESSRLSPTAIVTYLECKLRFYFRHIAKIPEPGAFTEEMDARDFGIIVHDILEKIYAPYQGKKVKKADLDSMLDPEFISTNVDQCFQEYHWQKDDQMLEGRNLINKSIIETLVKKVLENDRHSGPLTILGVETDELTTILEADHGLKILSGGTVDRIDELTDGIVRIIDYKTGKVDMLSKSKAEHSNLEEYIEEYFQNSKYKSGFQAYYYAYLFHKKYPNRPVKAGVYSLKEVNKGIQFLRNGDILSHELLQAFERRLKILINKIFDPKESFTQTDDLQKCEYCPYQGICLRTKT